MDKGAVCIETNAEGIEDGIAEALRGADVCIALSKSEPGVIQADLIRTMATDAIVFACANPLPEIWPWEAQVVGAPIVATGRSDFPNQLNDSLVRLSLFDPFRRAIELNLLDTDTKKVATRAFCQVAISKTKAWLSKKPQNIANEGRIAKVGLDACPYTEDRMSGGGLAGQASNNP